MKWVRGWDREAEKARCDSSVLKMRNIVYGLSRYEFRAVVIQNRGKIQFGQHVAKTN